MTLLDANYILRYLLQDDKEMFHKATEIIEKEECLLLGEVLAEVLYVLNGYYEVPRAEIAQVLTTLLTQPNLHTNQKREIYLEALEIFAENTLDYVDCLLCAVGKRMPVETFDKKLQKCLRNIEPVK